MLLDHSGISSIFVIVFLVVACALTKDYGYLIEAIIVFSKKLPPLCFFR